MMKASHIFLRPNVTRADALHMARWLADYDVTRFLHENTATALDMLAAVERSCLPDVSHLFHRGGRHFMIYSAHGPVGFLRLEKRPQEAELVVVIGETRCWGRGMGKAAIREALPVAFFEWRAPRVVANIHPENTRSMHAFRRLGFLEEYARPSGVRLCLSLADYLQREG